MTKNIYEKVVLIYLCLVLLLVQIGGIFLNYTQIDCMYYSNALFYMAVFGLFIYLYHKMECNKFKIKDLFVLLFMFFSFLSFYFAYDRYVAFNGFIGRREGLLALFAYYVFFLVASTLKNRKLVKIFIYAFSLHCLLQIIYGFLQVRGVENVFGIEIKHNFYHYSFGLVGNSNFFSSLQLLILGLWIGLYVFDDKLFNLKVVIPLFIFLMGIVLAGAMSGFVGFVMILLLVFIYGLYIFFSKKKNSFNIFIKLGIIVAMFSWVIVILSYIADSQYALDIFDLNQQTTQIVDEGLKDENGTGRIYIWKTALNNAPKYLWTGIGIDQFLYINDGKYIIDPITGNIIDKAHNEYLQILLTEGIFKAIVYIIFLLWIFFKAVLNILKSKKKNPILLALLLSYVGYAIQAFFNISVTTVAPIFFVITGLLLAQVDGSREEDCFEKS